MDSFDVVVVGGGIAGSSLAYALAREGLAVTVLEATLDYEDRVRGETMVPWGVDEARTLGVEQVLLDAGAHVAPTWTRYDDASPAGVDVPLNIMRPGIAGTLNVRHPADVMAVTQCEDAANRAARRAFLSAGMDAMDPAVFPLMIGLFAGPETIPAELVDPGILDRIRAAR